MEKIYKIFYVSKAQIPNHDCAEMIANQSSINNSALSITGILFYDGEHFCQHIEGEKENVDFLFDKIQKDDRHKELLVMEKGFIGDRKYEEWNMKYQELPDGTVLLCDLNYIKNLIK